VPLATTFYAAQIGAFKTEDIADALAQKFRLQGYEAYVQRGTAKDSSVVYRVLIGRFEKRKEAVTLAGTVGAKEKIKTTVFQGQ
jgi:cell division septation protein DedD